MILYFTSYVAVKIIFLLLYIDCRGKKNGKRTTFRKIEQTTRFVEYKLIKNIYIRENTLSRVARCLQQTELASVTRNQLFATNSDKYSPQ